MKSPADKIGFEKAVANLEAHLATAAETKADAAKKRIIRIATSFAERDFSTLPADSSLITNRKALGQVLTGLRNTQEAMAKLPDEAQVVVETTIRFPEPKDYGSKGTFPSERNNEEAATTWALLRRYLPDLISLIDEVEASIPTGKTGPQLRPEVVALCHGAARAWYEALGEPPSPTKTANPAPLLSILQDLVSAISGDAKLSNRIKATDYNHAVSELKAIIA